MSQDSKPALLVVDDDALILEYIREAVASSAVLTYGASDPESALGVFERVNPGLVFLDLRLGEEDGIEVMRRIHEIKPEASVVIMTANYSTESAVRAIQAGADDYLDKPISVTLLRDKVDQWLRDRDAQRRAAALEQDLLRSSTFEGIVGRSDALLDLLSKLRRIAPHIATALITGETGTGKELVAHALHALSRRSGPFVVCNCASIPESLFESELFGHKRGSFTGAISDHKGLVEAAENGTLFLDEVGEVPLSVQAKLLRLLQNREVRAVGATATRQMEVRIVAATNRDLREMCARGEFREDLFYRLSTVPFKLPPLRARREDIPLLSRNFLEKFSAAYGKPGLSLARRAEALLARYSWPGNIRELESTLNHAALLCEKSVIDIHDFPEDMVMRRDPQRLSRTLADVEHDHTIKTLQECEGNRAHAAEVLGIARATLYRILARSKEEAAAIPTPS